MIKATPAVQTIILLGEGGTQGPFHPEMGVIEDDHTRGHPIVGVGAQVWIIPGDRLDGVRINM
ncbi:hypothetical protein F3Y22_tig00110551pilonHSYRG00192 [Hibiscus syriacus]|uniref:Uncharacterized protein n=1 Tax=Hibiscus syriacus TaxID=106335 RepID=A0A6A3ADJ3_HIBSY|nr:hypothetical protein F3Y22_tig00110551pilonHSYRG00192 [Hibiscus syriacus]